MSRIYATEAERLEAKREAAREWKRRNKARRTAEGYVGEAEPGYKEKGALRKRYNHMKKEQIQLDKWWEALKKKHAKWKGTRLKKSLKPPVFLELDKGYGK